MRSSTIPTVLPPLSAMPSTMEPDDVRAYAALGFLQAQARTNDLSAEHRHAYCTLRSRGAAIDGIYDFWPLSRRAMRTIFATKDERTSTMDAVDDLLRPATEALHRRTPDPETLLDLKQQAQALSAALNELHDHERALVQRIYDVDLGASDDQLAAVVAGVHRSTVSRRHHNVLSRLRSIIGRSPTTPTKEIKRGPVTSAK